MNPIPSIMHALGFVKDRLGEASTWTAIAAAAAAVAALPAPWSYIGFGAACIAAMIPNKSSS